MPRQLAPYRAHAHRSGRTNSQRTFHGRSRLCASGSACAEEHETTERLAVASTLERGRLIDEHDGNAVANRVAEAAAGQSAPIPLRGIRARPCTSGRPGWPAAAGRRSWRTTRVTREADNRIDAASARSVASSEAPSPTGRDTRDTPTSASIFSRAAHPASRIWPPAPMIIRFWLSRSTWRTARMYTGDCASGTPRSRTRRYRGFVVELLKRSFAHELTTKNRTVCVLISSSG